MSESEDGSVPDHRVILVPENVVSGAKGDGPKSGISIIRLRHPRTQTCALFAISEDSKSIFELVKFSEHCRSWFIDELVEEDGSLYMATPIDPLFLILPYLLQNKTKFCPISDLLSEEKEYSCLSRLVHCCPDEQLNVLCDRKDMDGMPFWRYNQHKVLAWLNFKTHVLANALKAKNLGGTSGYHAAGFNSGRKLERKPDEKAELRYALGIILEYVPSQLEKAICDHMGISLDVKSISPKKGEKRKNSERDVEPLEDYGSKNNVGSSASKQAKLTPAQKRLAKVDKSGMKNISSFFAKKSVK